MGRSGDYQVARDIMKLTELNTETFEAEEAGNRDALVPLLTDDFQIVRSDYSVSDKQTMLDAVPSNAHKGRSVDEVFVRLYGDSAVVTSHLTTEDQDVVRHFWNTKVFTKHAGEWQCRVWQVSRIS